VVPLDGLDRWHPRHARSAVEGGLLRPQVSALRGLGLSLNRWKGALVLRDRELRKGAQGPSFPVPQTGP
jgi:hypothetical protein